MKTINGVTLKMMFISGANNLYNHYPEIDALNVFPVPDGDTGINMNLTLSSGAKEIANRNDENVYDIAKYFSKGLLMGARGNSGVITSQIFRGFALALEDKKEINAVALAEAFVSGKEVAYKAVMRPVEGTILTVIREASQAMLEKVNHSSSIEHAMAILLKEAEASLTRTPELLPILKEVGVVDSGGAGLVTILSGMVQALNGNVIEKSQATALEDKGGPIMAASSVDDEDEEYGYCTEFILRLGPEDQKKPFVDKRFTNVLSSHGNSLVVVHDEDIVKVHVHTMIPGSILSYAQNFGEFVTLKIENMSEQHNSLLGENSAPKSEKTEEKKELKEYGIVVTSVGDGLDEMFKELGATVIVSGGQTMNPSTEDFLEAIKKANAHHVIILPNNSNIIMAASQACDVFEGEAIKAYVVPSKTIPQGILASMMFNPTISVEENLRDMKAALKNVKSGSVTYAIKDTDIDGIHVIKDQFMGIFDGKIVTCKENASEASFEMISKMISEDSSIVTIITGVDAKSEDSAKLVSELEEKFPDIEFDVREGGQPIYSYIVGVE